MLSGQLPNALQPGDTIGLFAPASPFDPSLFSRGLEILAAHGFRTVCPPGLCQPREGLFAASDAQRRQQFNQLARDPGVKGLMAVRGGYGSMRMVAGIDWATVTRRRLPVVGFSDVTALLNVGLQQSGVAMLHGPTLTGLPNIDADSVASVFRALRQPSGQVALTAEARVLRPGIARGAVVGGNLTTLCHLTGTALQPHWAGCLVFLEDRGERPYRIDRMLTQMALAGYFQDIAGLFLGSFEDCGEIETLDGIISSHFDHFEGPIMAGFPMGHGSCNHAFWLGPEATLDTYKGSLAYHFGKPL